MTNNSITNKIKGLISENPSSWLKDADYYETNKDWLDKSALIAVKILSALRSQSLSQKELANKINVSPQYINKVLRGGENLSLATICKIEKSLSISLIAVPAFQSSQVIAGSFEWYPQIISRNNSLLIGSEKKDYNPDSNYSNKEEYQAA
jgi:transcriptional regulator with XRE-family HTH domain